MSLTQVPTSTSELEPTAGPEPELAAPSTAPVPTPSPPRPARFRRLIVFDSLADAVGCGGTA
jgi:hypothetical protein